MSRNDLTKFRFTLISSGAYAVSYHTKRGDFWIARIEDMTLIDATKNAENPKQNDIQELIRAVKRNGKHVRKSGVMIDY